MIISYDAIVLIQVLTNRWNSKFKGKTSKSLLKLQRVEVPKTTVFKERFPKID